MAVLNLSKTKLNLLAFLFGHADDAYYVRELSTLINEDAGNLSRELRRLEEEGVLRSRAKGRIKLYHLDKTCPIYSELKGILFKTEGAEGSLKKLLMKYKGIDTAFIYGSFAKGSEKNNSDIDLIIIGKFNRDQFTSELRSLESKLHREVNFTAYTKKDFAAERNKTGGFLNIVLKNRINLLKGFLNDK